VNPMIRALRRLFRSTTGTAAVEAAIFAPIFLIMTLGVTDLGSGMFVRMSVNAATQAGAAYTVINSRPGLLCWDTATSKPSLTTACLSGIKTTMNDASALKDATWAATGNPFCTGTAVCTATMTTPCVSPCVITVSANYPFTPILPDVVYSWAQSETVSSTTHIRIL
jgi:Flp pilus assembly protein TadG